MGIGNWLQSAIGNTASEVVSSVGETIDRFVTTDEEKAAARIELRKLDLRFQQLEMDAQAAVLRDRQSARAMYEKDSSLQKVYAVIFLVGYIGLSGALLYWIFGMLTGNSFAQELPNWAAALLSTVFTAMSTKVNTITDFLFGGSQSDRDHRDVAREFQGAVEESGK